eukprot:UN32121
MSLDVEKGQSSKNNSSNSAIMEKLSKDNSANSVMEKINQDLKKIKKTPVKPKVDLPISFNIFDNVTEMNQSLAIQESQKQNKETENKEVVKEFEKEMSGSIGKKIIKNVVQNRGDMS